MSGKDIVRRYSQNKKDPKRRNWVTMPKGQDEDNFLLINNILVNSNDFNKYKDSMEDMNELGKKKRIAYINYNMKNNLMDKTTLFGETVRSLINPQITDGRCHGCVLAMATCVDNFTWVYGNLTNRAIYFLDKSKDKINDYLLNTLYKESRTYDDIEPVFNHSYMIIEGKELIKQDLIHPNCSYFKVDENAKYVIDPRYDSIMKLDYYNKIMQPQYFTTYDKSEFEDTKIWDIVKKQSSIKPYDYEFEDFMELYDQTQNPSNKGLEKQICDMLLVDVSCMRPYSLRVSTFDYSACAIYEQKANTANQESAVIQK